MVEPKPLLRLEPEPEPEPLTPAENEPDVPIIEPEPTIALLNDGDLIRNPNAPGEEKFDVYIIKIVGDKKFKRLILSPAVFKNYKHLNWNNIKEVNQAASDAYTVSDLVRSDNSDKVYGLIPNGDTGTKQWLNMTASEFLSRYDSDSIYSVNSFELGIYKSEDDISA